MNKSVFYIAPIILLVLLSTCTKLEEDLVGEITEDINVDPITGPTSIIDYVTSGYSTFRLLGLANHGSYYSIQELTSDEMVLGVKGGDWYSDGSLIRLHQHTYTPFNVFLSNAWYNLYSNIDLLNEYLDNLSIQPEFLLEARAIRAFHYLCLLDLFGRVKIVTETDPNPPQASRAEVFEFVEQELLAALEIAEITPMMEPGNGMLYDGNNVYRLNHYGVLGLLAKLYLNAEVYIGQPMYEKAEIATSYIIDSGRYRLCGEGCTVTNLGKRLGVASDPDRLEGYAAVFAPNNDDNPEHIFAVYYDEIRGAGMNFSQMNLHYASQRSWDLKEQPWNGYATLEEFYNSYDDSDTRKNASFLVGPQLDFGGSAILDYQYDDDNIQLNYTPFINELAPNMLRQAGARPAKFSFKLFGRPDMDNDFPLVRLGEMYLIRAEAKARQSGNWIEAEPDVNLLRARAGVSEYSGNLTEEEFLAERGREMFQETTRRTDLIRFGRYNDAWWEKPPSEPFRNIFPIPIQPLNECLLTQNPGY